ncbi:ROK family protein [Prosthecobacter sp.]|uniref:ROK family protein n=1 Tax=Prosthecobacter sp. TaxID=1965333 RepID=UPI001E0C16A3|nr:ROK family protein [Prosthecobacter sp.]MCB1279242.1 ROK family protein [Prosthecobacter sp.]
MFLLDRRRINRLFIRMRKNPIFQRETLGAAVLQVRSGRATSRTTLAKALGISPSTVGLYVDQLIAERFLNESGLNQGPMGRPRRILTTRPDAGWFAGVEFNAQRIQAIGVDFSGAVLASVVQVLPAEVTADQVIKAILLSVSKLAASTRSPLLSVGLGVPGLVDAKAGVGLHYAFIPDWNDVPVVERIGSRLNVPVILQNNLRAIALAERWFGGGHELSNYVILGPRSGFGVAMVQDGKLIEGAHHAAGEMGRWPWPLADGKGSSQELHHALSAPATWRRLAGVGLRAKLPEDLREGLAELASKQGPEWDSVCEDFARVIGCLQLLADTGVFILHGPLTMLGTRFCESITQTALELMPALGAAGLRIVPSTLGDDAGALGAASLAMEAWMPA